MSTFCEVSGTYEHKEKGKTPKEEEPDNLFLGHMANNYMTVISRWRAINHCTGFETDHLYRLVFLILIKM